MSDFLTELGRDATAQDVFNGVYNHVDGLVQTLDALRVEEHGEGTSYKIIPGIPVQLNWSSVSHGLIKPSNDSTRTTYVEVPLGFGNNPSLLSRSTANISGVDHTYAVGALRGTELGSDFAIRRGVQHESVKFTVGKEGFWRTGQQPEETEPIGESIILNSEKIGLLPIEDRHRVRTITQKILDTVTAVEMIIDGEDPEAVLEANGTLLRAYDY